MANLTKSIEKTNLKCYLHENGNAFLSNASINNAKVKQISLTEYRRLKDNGAFYPLTIFNQGGIVVTKHDRGEVIGIEYNVKKGMISFNTSIEPVLEYKHLNTLIEDYSEMCIEDYSNVAEHDFTPFEIID